MLNEAEWLTRKKRIDTRLCALTPPWKIIRYRDGLNLSYLHCVAVEEFPTANGPADYALFVNGVLLGIAECYANLECKVIDRKLVTQYNFFILEVVKAWIDPRRKRPRTMHHQGEGVFAVPGRTIKLPSPKTSFLAK